VYYEETCRLIEVIGKPAGERVRFYGVNGTEDGQCTYFNLQYISKINILDSMPGLELELPPDIPEEQWAKRVQKREISDQRVIIRLFLRSDKEPVVIYDVEHPDWESIASILDDVDEVCIWLVDNDGERVIYPLSEIRAIEMIDPFYQSEEKVDSWLYRYEKEKPNQSSDPSMRGVNRQV
jgi:hypothetical protein